MDANSLMLAVTVGLVPAGLLLVVVLRRKPSTTLLPRLALRADVASQAAGAPQATLQISGLARGPFELPLPPQRALTFGRDSSNDLTIDHHLVSRRHARLSGDAQGWRLEDLNSSNGTFVNGRPIQSVRLKHGDLIEIGPARLLLNSAVVPEAAPGIPQAQPGPVSDRPDSRRQFGRYQVVRQIGEGGFGKIFLAQDSRDKRLAALKVLISDDDYLNTKFKQEGAIKLDHPHIARIYETGEASGQAYIAMEYVNGITLRKYMQRAALPLETALAITGQMLAALEYAHQRQVIHRDIKPDNVMISAEHGVKIIDFGIAKVLSTVTRTQGGIVIGTPQYLSYEQATGQPVVPASDLYSVAIVIYEMLTGMVPFTADQPMDVLRLHLSAQPQPLRALNAAVPLPIEQAVLRALSKRADQRFSSAAAFAAALGIVGLPQLPAAVLSDVARRALPVTNELGNAGQLPTRAPAAFMPSGDRPVLRVESGARRGLLIDVAASRAVGRLDIDPHDGTISRRHVMIERTGDVFLIVDGSTYGTMLDGRRLVSGQAHALRHGAQLQVGQTVLTFLAHQQPL